MILPPFGVDEADLAHDTNAMDKALHFHALISISVHGVHSWFTLQRRRRSALLIKTTTIATMANPWNKPRMLSA